MDSNKCTIQHYESTIEGSWLGIGEDLSFLFFFSFYISHSFLVWSNEKFLKNRTEMKCGDGCTAVGGYPGATDCNGKIMSLELFTNENFFL